MSQYTGVRYTAINPVEFGTSSNGKSHPVAAKLATLTEKNGNVNWKQVDKLSGRRITDDFSVDWFTRTFQCVNRPLGVPVYTTIGELAESMSNEHFAQFPPIVDRIKAILGEANTGLLVTWNLAMDVEVGFVVPNSKTLNDFTFKDEQGRLRLDIMNKEGIIVSGRHRLVAVMTLLEHGLKLKYDEYSDFLIRVRATAFPSAEEMAAFVRLANTTRKMARPEVDNIKSQVKRGAGFTSDIAAQLASIIEPKAKITEQKPTFANIFRTITSGDTFEGRPVTDIVRYSVGVKLFDALFSSYGEDKNNKHHPRFSKERLTIGVISTILTLAKDSYRDGFKGITNIARDGIETSVEYAVDNIVNFFKNQGAKLDTPLLSKTFTSPSVTVKDYEPLVSSAVDNETDTSYSSDISERNDSPQETETTPAPTIKAKVAFKSKKAGHETSDAIDVKAVPVDEAPKAKVAITAKAKISTRKSL